MKLHVVWSIVSCVVWKVYTHPTYYPYYGPNVDALSYGADGDSQRAMVMSRYYQPYYPRSAGGGMAAFMFGQPQEASKPPREDYYLPDRRRQTPEIQYLPPQQNEVYPQIPEKVPLVPTEHTEIVEHTERVDLLLPTTAKTELAEPEVEEVEEATSRPKNRVSKKKQVKKPVDDDEDEDDYAPKMPAGAFFPMFFGWGGRSGGGGGSPGGAMAVANAYSTGRGGVASSHATAYGAPRPEDRKAGQ